MGAHERRWWRVTEDAAHLRKCLRSWTPRRRDRDSTDRRLLVIDQLDELLEKLERRRPAPRALIEIRRRVA